MNKDIRIDEECVDAKNEKCKLATNKGDYNCMTCPFKQDSLIYDLSISELEKLDNYRYVLNYEAGELIFKEGDKPLGLLCLSKGKVKIIKSTNHGTEQIVDLYRPVEFISLKSMLTKSMYTSSAIAIEETMICVLDPDSFYDVVANNFPFSLRLFSLLGNMLNEKEIRMLNLTHKHMRARMAYSLLFLHRRYGVSADNILNVKLKRHELASLSNMIQTNAIRVLSAFVNEGIVETENRSIKILDFKGLEEISENGHIIKKHTPL